MGISPKNRRQIIVNDRTFYWQARQEEEWAEEGWPVVLSVTSEDKQFNIIYGVDQAEADCHLVNLGSDFPMFPHGQSGKKAGKNINHYRRVPCPKWGQGASMTPGIVREIIDWCFTIEPKID
jgi:hypothetical protein